MMNYLFLSPHYDDAVFSCAGTMFQLVQSGASVTMLTIMAGSPTEPLPDTPVLRANHSRWQAGDNPVLARRAEDEAAAAILGVNTQYYDFPDCIYRTAQGQALYPSEESLWGAPHAEDNVRQFLQEQSILNYDAIYAPLGVGSHVDHQIVRDWALALMRQGQMVYFYEDYPYLRDKEKLQAGLNYFQTNLRAINTVLTEASMQAKIQAMSAYRSQISSFWANEAAIGDEVRTTFTDELTGRYRERAWIAQS